jgi:amino acid transporter
VQNSSSAENAAAALAGFGLIGFVMVIAMLVFFIVVYWKIAAKAGYNGAMSLLLFVPLVNIAIIIMFAFSRWPIEEALACARQRSGSDLLNASSPSGM